MNTHSAKTFLAVIASMVALAVTSTSRPVFADDKRECAWAQIKELGAPNIGTNGHIALAETIGGRLVTQNSPICRERSRPELLHFRKM